MLIILLHCLCALKNTNSNDEGELLLGLLLLGAEARALCRVRRRAPGCRRRRRRSARRRSTRFGDAEQCSFSCSLRPGYITTTRACALRHRTNWDCFGLNPPPPVTHTAVKCVAGRARARCREQTEEEKDVMKKMMKTMMAARCRG